jgi:hypothetical protein
VVDDRVGELRFRHPMIKSVVGRGVDARRTTLGAPATGRPVRRPARTAREPPRRSGGTTQTRTLRSPSRTAPIARSSAARWSARSLGCCARPISAPTRPVRPRAATNPLARGAPARNRWPGGTARAPPGGGTNDDRPSPPRTRAARRQRSARPRRSAGAPGARRSDEWAQPAGRRRGTTTSSLPASVESGQRFRRRPNTAYDQPGFI